MPTTTRIGTSHDIAFLRAEIERVKHKLTPLRRQLESLTRQLAEAESIEYIKVNGITKANTYHPKDPGMPYFNTVWDLADWLKLRGSDLKPWASWNDRIYSSRQLIVGLMPDSVARYDDLPNS